MCICIYTYIYTFKRVNIEKNPFNLSRIENPTKFIVKVLVSRMASKVKK